MYSIKEPSDYMGGFIATGTMAIVQTIAPLLIGQLWKRDDLALAGYNPWFAYAWKAMQAGGTIAFGLQAFGFLLSLIFELNFFEKLGYIGLWAIHGAIFGQLSFITVVSYFIAAIAKYKTSIYEDTTEMWITLAVYAAVQTAAGFVGLTYMKDTVMYLIAQELKDICETYGALCGEMGVLQPTSQTTGQTIGQTTDDFDDSLLGGDSAGSNLSTWAWN